jgi:hypothetical protein
MALGSTTQRLTEMSTVSLLSRKCGNLDVPQTLWASTPSYRDSFTYLLTNVNYVNFFEGKEPNRT